MPKDGLHINDKGKCSLCGFRIVWNKEHRVWHCDCGHGEPKDEWRTTKEVVRVHRTMHDEDKDPVFINDKCIAFVNRTVLDMMLSKRLEEGEHRTVEVEVRVREPSGNTGELEEDEAFIESLYTCKECGHVDEPSGNTGEIDHISPSRAERIEGDVEELRATINTLMARTTNQHNEICNLNKKFKDIDKLKERVDVNLSSVNKLWGAVHKLQGAMSEIAEWFKKKGRLYDDYKVVAEAFKKWGFK